MSQSKPDSAIIISHLTSRTSIVLKAGYHLEPVRANGREDDATNIVTAATVTKDIRFSQCHIEITDILAFGQKLRIYNLNQSGKRRRTFRAGPGFSRSKNPGLMMNHHLFLTTKDTEKSARETGPGNRYVFPKQEMFGVSL